MKFRLFTLFFLLILLCGSCSKQEPELNIEDLNQTQWTGILSYNHQNVLKDYKLRIAFNSKSTGYYQIDNLPDIIYSPKSTFKYHLINPKIIKIFAVNSTIMEGEGWIYEKDKNSMLLKRDPLDKERISILELKKTY